MHKLPGLLAALLLALPPLVAAEEPDEGESGLTARTSPASSSARSAPPCAAQGPLWAPGGDRGLYKTTDGGESWMRVLEISEDTGVSDVAFDPRDPDVLYAASFQRRRRQWALVAGGPESTVCKSTDAGATWRRLTRGRCASTSRDCEFRSSPTAQRNGMWNLFSVSSLSTKSGRVGGYLRGHMPWPYETLT